MDIPSIAASLTALLAPALPALLHGGGKLAEGFVQQIGADAWGKVREVWQRLQPRLEARPSALEAAQDVAETPEDEDLQAVLRVQLKKLLSADEALAAELAELVKEAGQKISYQAELHGSGAIAQGKGAVAAGEGGVAVKGDIHGGINLSGSQDSKNKE